MNVTIGQFVYPKQALMFRWLGWARDMRAWDKRFFWRWNWFCGVSFIRLTTWKQVLVFRWPRRAKDMRANSSQFWGICKTTLLAMLWLCIYKDRTRLGRYSPIKNLIIPLVERLVAHWVVTTRRWAPSLYLCSLSLKLEDFFFLPVRTEFSADAQQSCRVVPLWFSWYTGRRTSWTTWWLSSDKVYHSWIDACVGDGDRAKLKSRFGLSRSKLAAAHSWMNVTVNSNVTLHVMTSSLVDWRNQQWRDAMNTTYLSKSTASVQSNLHTEQIDLLFTWGNSWRFIIFLPPTHPFLLEWDYASNEV